VIRRKNVPWAKKRLERRQEARRGPRCLLSRGGDGGSRENVGEGTGGALVASTLHEEETRFFAATTTRRPRKDLAGLIPPWRAVRFEDEAA
jgi:hypothetical protein